MCIQAIELVGTQVTGFQLLAAAAVTGVLTFAAVAERKSIQRSGL